MISPRIIFDLSLSLFYPSLPQGQSQVGFCFTAFVHAVSVAFFGGGCILVFPSSSDPHFFCLRDSLCYLVCLMLVKLLSLPLSLYSHYTAHCLFLVCWPPVQTMFVFTLFVHAQTLNR